MILSFACKETKTLFEREVTPAFPVDIQRPALRKLKIIEAAVTLEDLKAPPGNRLEKLKRDREGYYSIRINSQWRICFMFKGSDAFEVEIVDYH